MKCNLCPRSCNAERGELGGAGFCKLGTLPKAARIAPHYWEEPCISGKNGSGAVFFSGCTMRCVFCQNFDISAKNSGAYITTERLAEYFRELEEKGVHNINLVSPTPYVDAIIEALELYKPNIPIVYNCGGYEKPLTLRRLEGYVDIYLPDLKYADDALALRYSGVKNYTQVALAAIAEMIRQTGPAEFDESGMMLRGTIVRHLVLPNHTKNSKAVIDIVAKEFPDAFISLMGQYIPMGQAEKYPELNRKITSREYRKVKDYLFETELDGFVQELSSADKKYVPDWNLADKQQLDN